MSRPEQRTTAPSNAGRPARSRRRQVVATGVAAVVVIGCGVIAVASVTQGAASGAPGAASTVAPSGSRSTAPVTRGDLTEQRRFSGTLGHGPTTDLLGSGSGTLTWLPAHGQVVHRDEVLYRRDERPVRAMHGTVPLWRSLQRGLRGTDVAQLNQNLAALGYDVERDDRFGDRTAAAVRQWQRDRGLAVTGALTADDIAFVDGDVRVADRSATAGAPASGRLYGYTSTLRTVSVPIDEVDAAAFPLGSRVSVAFPGSSERRDAVVRSIGEDPDADGGLRAEAELEGELPVGVSEAGGVDVRVTGTTREDVLSVPVSALLAARRDGFAVERVRAGHLERVPVEVGFAADGRVEVTAGALRVGDRVVVPS